MSEETTKPGTLEVVDRIGKEAQFRSNVIEDPEKALAGYQLEPTQKAALVQMAKGFAADAQESKAAAVKAATKWYLPGSFREAAGAVLSLTLIGLLLWAAARTYGLISTPPAGKAIGETIVQWSAFDRATTFFSTLFPLFAAVVTFYLGVAVEGRRADKAEESADKAQGQVENADKKKDEAEKEAKAEKAKREGIVQEVSGLLTEKERLESTGETWQADDVFDQLDKIVKKYS